MVPQEDKGNKKKGHADKMPNRRYGYFRDDQIMFLVTHTTDTVSHRLLEKFKEVINGHLGAMDGGAIEASPLPFSFSVPRDEYFQQRFVELERRERLAHEEKKKRLEQAGKQVSAFRRPFDVNFSMLVCNLTGAPQEPIDLLNNIRKLREAVVGEVIAVNGGEGPIYIAKEGEGETPPPDVAALGESDSTDERMTIQDASPNWLMSVASQGAGTGGPGGLPRPFKGTDLEGSALYKFTEFIKKLDGLGLYGTGENVDIAILDTARPEEDLVLAPKDHPDNRLLQELVGPNGVLTTYHLTPAETRRMQNTSLNKHDYPMNDHGLFAAGIVHSIVPDAKIHLVQVLNQFGVGDLQALADGLKKVHDEIYKPGSGRKLVVNCSWMLDLPPTPEHCWAEEEDPEYDFEQAVEKFDEEEEREHAMAIWAACNNLFCAGAQVVAAAGNDWDWAKQRREARRNSQPGNTRTQADDEARGNAPEARYPAGYVSAVGVGALPKRVKLRNGKYPTSKYSNLGDKPAGDAIMTLGGEHGRKKGVLGLYLSQEYPVEKKPAPPPPPNDHRREFRMIRRSGSERNSWGWWAGTSFATPILTGTIAAVLSSPKRPASTQEVLELLAHEDYRIIEPAMTDAEEDVMLVTQDDELLKRSDSDDDDD